MNINARLVSFELLHPKAVESFHGLNEFLARSYETGKTKTLFKAFESYRSPVRQADVFALGASKARPWQSSHQYGLAVDFVPFIPLSTTGTVGEWSWAKVHDYEFLAAAARRFGLAVPIDWDLCHVEHPLWLKLRKLV